MTHVLPYRDEGSEQIAAQVFAQRVAASTSATTTASAVSISDAGNYFTGTNVEAALQELGAGTTVGMPVGSQIGFAYTSTTTAVTAGAGIPYDNTIPQNTEGTSWAALDTAYTPVAASSLLEIEVRIPSFQLSGNNSLILALFQDSTANAIGTTILAPPNASYDEAIIFKITVAASSTAARTYKLRYGTTGGATAFLLSNGGFGLFGGTLVASMTIREIKQ